jgi:hypothetical protein
MDQAGDGLMIFLTWLPWGLLLAVLVSQVPLFMQEGLTPDAINFDMQARCALEGGVLYRDLSELNFPGMTWCHMLLRSTWGWSPYVLRSADLIVMLLNGFLLSILATANLSVPTAIRWALRGYFLLSVTVFYFGTSEWCHCQRDPWMLLPCLGALFLRWHVWSLKVAPPVDGTITRHKILMVDSNFSLIAIYTFGIAEGLLWGIAFWMKPYVAIPALSLILITGLQQQHPQRYQAHTICVIIGGALIGTIGSAWMIYTGAWSHFWETLRTINPQYLASSSKRSTLGIYLGHTQRFWPYILFHLSAIYFTTKQFLRLIHAISNTEIPLPKALPASMEYRLLGAFYFGWLIQSFGMQQVFDYVHVSGIFIAMAITWQGWWEWIIPHALQTNSSSETLSNTDDDTVQLFITYRITSLNLGLVVAMFVLEPSAVVQWRRLKHWQECVSTPAPDLLAPETRDDLRIWPFPRWVEFEPLLRFLEDKQLKDRSVLVYSGNMMPVYPRLNLHAPAKYLYPDVGARLFPGMRDTFLNAYQESPMMYIVCDIREDGWTGDDPQGLFKLSDVGLTPDTVFFPYNQEPVFRSGGYLVFEKTAELGTMTTVYEPLGKPIGSLAPINIPSTVPDGP